jgi:pimeloyl-ACP methyl ester carboxylesterase
VSGSGERAFVLLHGLVTSSDTFGSSYDRLASYARLVVPDLLGFGRSMIFEPRELGKKFDRKV